MAKASEISMIFGDVQRIIFGALLLRNMEREAEKPVKHLPTTRFNIGVRSVSGRITGAPVLAVVKAVNATKAIERYRQRTNSRANNLTAWQTSDGFYDSFSGRND
jgi:hypothetical protein